MLLNLGVPTLHLLFNVELWRSTVYSLVSLKQPASDIEAAPSDGNIGVQDSVSDGQKKGLVWSSLTTSNP